MKQVDSTHYEFSRYLSKGRWSSVWHQIDEVVKRKPRSVLEVGPGPGVFKTLAKLLGLNIETLDVDPDLGPDYIGSATSLPFRSQSYDVVCAFQMLEHLPYEASLKAFSEMARVATKYVIISLPDADTLWTYSFHIPMVGGKRFHIKKPQFRYPEHEFDGEHYWELNKRGYELEKVKNDLQLTTGSVLESTYRVEENPFHRFFVFRIC